MTACLKSSDKSHRKFPVLFQFFKKLCGISLYKICQAYLHIFFTVFKTSRNDPVTDLQQIISGSVFLIFFMILKKACYDLLIFMKYMDHFMGMIIIIFFHPSSGFFLCICHKSSAGVKKKFCLSQSFFLVADSLLHRLKDIIQHFLFLAEPFHVFFLRRQSFCNDLPWSLTDLSCKPLFTGLSHVRIKHPLTYINHRTVFQDLL